MRPPDEATTALLDSYLVLSPAAWPSLDPRDGVLVLSSPDATRPIAVKDYWIIQLLNEFASPARVRDAQPRFADHDVAEVLDAIRGLRADGVLQDAHEALPIFWVAPGEAAGHPLVGQSTRRVDGVDKVLGAALFPADIRLDHPLHVAVLFSARPHAIVRAVDTTCAETAEGVVAVFTSRDLAGLRTGHAPLLSGPGSGRANGDCVRHVGTPLALVVAQTEAAATAARREIRVEYEDRPVVSDPLWALGEHAPILFPEFGSNLRCRLVREKGDPDAAFTRADVIVGGEYRTPAQEHAFLQPEAAIGYHDAQGRLVVVTAGQHLHLDRAVIAWTLGLPEDQVLVEYATVGGAFGGRIDGVAPLVVGFVTWKLRQMGVDRPVSMVWSRPESTVGHHKRHPATIRLRWAAKETGEVVAAKGEVILDGGASPLPYSGVLFYAVRACTGPYEIPNLRLVGLSAATNNIPGGAFRGYGVPQALFAAEMQMNRLAEALAIDPVEIRLRNALREGSLLASGAPVPRGVTLPDVIQRCAGSAGWTRTATGWRRPPQSMASRKDRRHPEVVPGTGFACGFQPCGDYTGGLPDPFPIEVELAGETSIERATIRAELTELGQGSHTVVIQMAAEALGVSPDRIHLETSRTVAGRGSGGPHASRTTFMAGNAIRQACRTARERWDREKRIVVVRSTYLAPRTTPPNPVGRTALEDYIFTYAAEAVRVDVDTATGGARVAAVTAVADPGRAINPQLVEGQVRGAVAQALGFTLLENFVQKDGVVESVDFSTYLVPTATDIPGKVDTLLAEHPDPLGPWGAHGVGEVAFSPFAPAVADAVHDATGAWIFELPLTPERVLAAIEDHDRYADWGYVVRPARDGPATFEEAIPAVRQEAKRLTRPGELDVLLRTSRLFFVDLVGWPHEESSGSAAGRGAGGARRD
jgi:CO/xanthine dehydrogenase Mo-binding subunit